MEKYIKRKLKYNKSLRLDEESLRELNNLYSELDLMAKYSIETENSINYNFDTLEELLQYDFSDDIKVLKIYKDDYKRKENLDIEFKVDYLSPLAVYGTIAEISYSTSNENIDIVLKEKIEKFFKKYATHNWIIGKFGLFGYFSIFIILLLIIVLIVSHLNNKSISLSFSKDLFISWIICWIIIALIRKFDTLICKKYFKPIIYYLGKQKKQTEKIEKIKSNIFWGIIVAIIVGIITTIICNNILK